MKKVAVLILAAGSSSRMKTPKQLLKIGNKTLLEIVLEKAKFIFEEPVFCVLGANEKLIRKTINTKNIEFIYNKNYLEGLSTSIVSGIKYLEKTSNHFDGIMILLADQPAIDSVYLKNLLHLFQTNKNSLIASKYQDKVGVPAIFPKEYFNELKLLKGDEGAKKIIIKNKKDTIYSSLTSNFTDIDTKKDYLLYFQNTKKAECK